jgi:alpha-galactosidase/6-phospho-beta-glucosidase family protein
MEDPEVPTEHLHEHIHEAAHEHHDKWSMLVAISTAFMAAFAALSSLMAGHHSNEALITQIKASDQWAYYNAKGIKAEVADGVAQLSTAKYADSTKSSNARTAKLKEDQKEIKEKAEELEKESEVHLGKDIILARAVTFFQIAISISAVSILSKKRPLWYVSLILFAVGIFQFVMGLL